MNICCCQEHVDLALDIIVDECQAAPFIHNAKEKNETEKNCEFCKNEAKYVVSDQ